MEISFIDVIFVYVNLLKIMIPCINVIIANHKLIKVVMVVS